MIISVYFLPLQPHHHIICFTPPPVMPHFKAKTTSAVYMNFRMRLYWSDMCIRSQRHTHTYMCTHICTSAFLTQHLFLHSIALQPYHSFAHTQEQFMNQTHASKSQQRTIKKSPQENAIIAVHNKNTKSPRYSIYNYLPGLFYSDLANDFNVFWVICVIEINPHNNWNMLCLGPLFPVKKLM